MTADNSSTTYSRKAAKASRGVDSSSPAAQQAAASCAVSISRHWLPQLQQLSFGDGEIPVDHLKQVSQSTGLTSLSVNNMVVSNSTTTSKGAPGALLSTALHSVLAQLPGLSQLLLLNISPQVQHRSRPHALAPISAMQCLQRLSLDGTCCSDISTVLSGLPVSLTCLQLTDMDVCPDVSEMRATTRLTNLQRLELHNLMLDGLKLASWQKLTYLSLSAVDLACRIDSDSGYDLEHDADDLEVQALLKAMGRLKRLEHLRLESIELLQQAVHLRQFSALTASSNLTALHLKGPDDVLPVPRGAVKHMFSPKVSLPNLRILQLVVNHGTSGQDWCPLGDRRPYCVDSNDVVRVVQCCPRLQDLTMVGVLRKSCDLGNVQQLAGSLRKLEFSGSAVCDSAACVLGALTNLTSLHLMAAPLSPSGLQHWTALQQLQEFTLSGCSVVSKSLGCDRCLHLTSSQQVGPVECCRLRLSCHNDRAQMHQLALLAVLLAPTNVRVSDQIHRLWASGLPCVAWLCCTQVATQCSCF